MRPGGERFVGTVDLDGQRRVIRDDHEAFWDLAFSASLDDGGPSRAQGVQSTALACMVSRYSRTEATLPSRTLNRK